MPIKSAVVLFVKNERHDIMGWISWYVELGFDHIFIYDDHSTDGTYEICQSASKVFSLTVEKSDLNEGNFFYRQRNSYLSACLKYSDDFDWIAFLDADEYLFIDNHIKINDFLSGFPEEASAIALSWKIYGSSNRVLYDNIPTYQAFLHHSDVSLNDNSLVKSIVRPKKISTEYENPHKFNLIDGKYLDSLGNIVEWLPGATKNIVWEKAWINHYICRSMEHYTSRIKRRLGVDLSNTTEYWKHFDRNDHFFDIDESLLSSLDKKISKIKNQTIKDCLSYFQKNNISYPSKDEILYGKEYTLYELVSYHGKILHTNNIDGHLVQGVNKNKNKLYVLLDEENKKSFFFRMENDIIYNVKFFIFSDNRKSYIYDFIFNKIDNEYYSFKSSENQKYLSSLPESGGDIVECNRDIVSEWEKFKLFDSGKKINIKFKFMNNLSIEDMNKKIKQSFGSLSPNEFILNLNMLSSLDKHNFVIYSNNRINWLL